MNPEFQTELQVYFFDSETLSPQSSKQRRSLFKTCLSELNPDVLAKIKRREKQSTSEKRSKRKKAYSYWMSGIGGPLLVGLTIFLGAFGTFTVSRMMGSRDTTPVTDSASSSGKEAQSTQRPKGQDTAEVKQPLTQSTKFVPNKELEFIIFNAFGATNIWQLMATVPLSPLSAGSTNSYNPALSHLFPKGEKTPMATSP
jgi:hypothetical protein